MQLSTPLKVTRLTLVAILPSKAHPGDLGYDLYAAEEATLMPGETRLVYTGIALGFPAGYGGLIRDRSSMATKRELFVVAGVIDNGYTGEVKVALFNASHEPRWIQPGEKIAQLILIPVYDAIVLEVETLDETSRGDKGFGSSGQ